MEMVLLQVPFRTSLAKFFLILGSISCLAAFGYLVNDLSDLEADRHAGKANALDRLSPIQRQSLIALVAIAGLTPIGFVDNWVAALVLILNYALAAAYSVAP